MSIIFEHENAVLISHKKCIDSMYSCVDDKSYCINSDLFEIAYPYKNAHDTKESQVLSFVKVTLRDDVEVIKRRYSGFLEVLYAENILTRPIQINSKNNNLVLKVAEHVYKETGRVVIENLLGANIGPATLKKIGDNNYLFPKNSIFYAKNVLDIDKYLLDKNYDAILLDPPWWNKYIRRKKKKSNDGYPMMFNSDLKNLPIERLLKDEGLLIVWCTNSEQHFKYLLEEIFPKWNVKYVSMWYWIKITTSGKPICKFSMPPGKQPFERIIFARRNCSLINPPNEKLIVSIPSALHSHKPPLVELIKEFLPENVSGLELFARYLLPGWTSYGNEVLRLQHESVYS